MSDLRKSITNVITQFSNEYEFKDTLKVLQTNIKGLTGIKMKISTLNRITKIRVIGRCWSERPHPEFLRGMQKDLIVSLLEFCAMPDLYERVSKEICFYKRYGDLSKDLKGRTYRKIMKAQLYRAAERRGDLPAYRTWIDMEFDRVA